MRFSIVVPVYKVEEFLRKCVDSLLEQSCDDYEIILVDDGSPDASPSICDEYVSADSRIKVIHKKNGGLVSARRAGLEIATGDYICCVDSDDFVDKDYLKVISEIAREHNPDVICFGYSRYSDGEIRPVESYAKYPLGYYDRKKMIEKVYPTLIFSESGAYFLPTVWSKAYKRELYSKFQLGVDTRITMGEDAACTIPIIMNANSMFISDKKLYYYRQNLQSMTKGKHVYSYDNVLLIDGVLSKADEASEYCFNDQIKRRTAKSFFNTAKSQFNRNESYGVIAKEVLQYMKDPTIADSIKNACFSGNRKIKIMHFILKNKMIPLIYLSKLFNLC